MLSRKAYGNEDQGELPARSKRAAGRRGTQLHSASSKVELHSASAKVQAMLQEPTDSSSVGIIADLFQACLDLLTHISSNVKAMSTSQKRSLQRTTQCLFLWGDSHEVANGSLDLHLQKSKPLMKVIVGNLRSLLMSVFFGKPYLNLLTACLNKSLGLLDPEKRNEIDLYVLSLLDRSRFAERDEDDSRSGGSDDEEEEEDPSQHFSSKPVDEILSNLSRDIERLNDLDSPLQLPILEPELKPESESSLLNRVNIDDAHGRIILAVDFGTKFSSVAFVRLGGMIENTALDLKNVKCITRYPGDPSASQHARQPSKDVPTELWYSLGGSPGQGPSNSISIELTGDGSNSKHISEYKFSNESSFETEIELEKETKQKKKKKRNSSTLFWGFEVQSQLQRIDKPKQCMKRVARFKLMLDEKNASTTHIREEIRTIIRNLKRFKLIKKDTDIISDYLTHLFTHIRNELHKTLDFDDETPIEFVLPIPAIWSSKACRIMQTATAIAAQRSGLGQWKKESLSNFFVVSEPEAAASYVLAKYSSDISVSSISNSFIEFTI
jgi:hypothetical protein